MDKAAFISAVWKAVHEIDALARAHKLMGNVIVAEGIEKDISAPLRDALRQFQS